MNDAPHRGDDRVPPDQYVTKKWPVLSCGDTPEVDPARFALRLFGRVETERAFDWQALQALPRREVVADFHCVTRFSTLDNPWSGFSTRDVLAAVQPTTDTTHAMLHCLRRLHDEPAARRLAVRARPVRRPSRRRTAGARPRRSVAPGGAPPLAWKSAKWVSGIALLAGHERGFWEENGYHAYGDPLGGAALLVAGDAAGVAGPAGSWGQLNRPSLETDDPKAVPLCLTWRRTGAGTVQARPR